MEEKEGMINFLTIERTKAEKELKVVSVKLKMVEKQLDERTKELDFYRPKVKEIKATITKMETMFLKLKILRKWLDE